MNQALLDGKVLRIALVGCGRISSKHFSAIAKDARLKLVGVCDNNEDRANLAALTNHTQAFTDYEMMLDSIKPDIISICTPKPCEFVISPRWRSIYDSITVPCVARGL